MKNFTEFLKKFSLDESIFVLSILIVLCFGNLHVLESLDWSQHRASNPAWFWSVLLLLNGDLYAFSWIPKIIQKSFFESMNKRDSSSQNEILRDNFS